MKDPNTSSLILENRGTGTCQSLKRLWKKKLDSEASWCFNYYLPFLIFSSLFWMFENKETYTQINGASESVESLAMSS